MERKYQKVSSWVERLHGCILESQWQPYEWGKHDCVTFMANCVWAMTGDDPIAEYRGEPWKTEEEAMVVLTAEGGLIAAMDKRFERRPSVLEVMRGDPVMLRDAQGKPSLGIWTGASIATPGFEEVLYAELRDVRIAWRVD